MINDFLKANWWAVIALVWLTVILTDVPRGIF